MKRFLILLPWLIFGFILFSPTKADASVGPEPNFYLLCGQPEPVVHIVWADSPTLNQALKAREPFLPAKKEIQALIFQDDVIKSMVLENSADAEAYVRSYWPETNCGHLTLDTTGDLLVARIVKPDYCVTKIFPGCSIWNNFTVAPLKKINHDISTGQTLPLFLLVGSLVVGIFVGRYRSGTPFKQGKLSIVFKTLGLLILGGILFFISIFFAPNISNWIVYPSVPELYLRLIILAALVSNFFFRPQLTSAANRSASVDEINTRNPQV